MYRTYLRQRGAYFGDNLRRVLEMEIVSDPWKDGERGIGSSGKRQAHGAVDIDILLAPQDAHGRLQSGQICLEPDLVSRKVRVIAIECIGRGDFRPVPQPN